MPQAIHEHTYSIHATARLQFIVESPCETHDRLDVGQTTKRYIFESKMGVVTTKGIFYRGGK